MKQKKIVNKTGICIDNNEKDILFKYEYEGKYYENCLNGNLINNSIIKSCNCNKTECSSCPKIPLKEKNLCIECNNYYYEIENDNDTNIYKKCYKDPKGYYLDNNIYKKCFNTCSECKINGNNITHNCISCNENYPIEIKMNNYSNCYNGSFKGYYIDKDEQMFKKCYFTCEECEIKGNDTFHNCLECNGNFTFNISFNNYTNCYQKCPYYYYFDNDNNYHCTINASCPNDYPYLSKDKFECSKNEIKNETQDILYINTYKTDEINYVDTIIETIDNHFTSENYYTTQLDYGIDEQIVTEKMIMILNITKDILNITYNETEEINYYDTIIKRIEDYFTSENFDTTQLDSGKDEQIVTEKMIITLTTTENQKNNKNANLTIIELGDCERNLRQFYNLSINETIYMKKIENRCETGRNENSKD